MQLLLIPLKAKYRALISQGGTEITPLILCIPWHRIVLLLLLILLFPLSFVTLHKKLNLRLCIRP